MTEGGTVEVAGRTITVTSPDGPPVTRARVSAAGMAEPPATRETPARGPNSDRPGRVRLLAVSSGFGPAWRVDGGKIVSLTA